MILLGASSAAAEVPVHLATPSNPLTPVTGYGWSTGDLQVFWPGTGSFVNAPTGNIVEKGFGDYALQGTSTNTSVAGCVYVYAEPSVSQPFRGVEFVTDPNDPAIHEVPFTLMSLSNPVYTGVTGHSFTLGEVQICFAGGSYANVPTSQIVEKGYGMYAVVLTSPQRLNVDKVYVSAQVSGAVPFTADWDMVVSTYIGPVPVAAPPAPIVSEPPFLETAPPAGSVVIVIPTAPNVVLMAAENITANLLAQQPSNLVLPSLYKRAYLIAHGPTDEIAVVKN